MKLQGAGLAWLCQLQRSCGTSRNHLTPVSLSLQLDPSRVFSTENTKSWLQPPGGQHAFTRGSLPQGCTFFHYRDSPAPLGSSALRWYSSGSRQGVHEPACVNLAGSAGSQAAQAATIGALTSAERAAEAAAVDYGEPSGGQGQHGGSGRQTSVGQAAAEAHRHESNISLHSAMQSSVPLPYSHDSKSPNHRNMPPAGGAAAPGGHLQRDKFLYSDQQVGGGDAGMLEEKTAAPAQLSQKERMKKAVKEYGATVVIFHVSISLCTLGISYAAVSSGLDVVGLLAKLGVGQSILESKMATGASTFVVAYAVHKVFAPVRMAATLTATPIIVHYLRRAGVLKAPPARKH